jgi:hypothetical protein
VHCSDIAISSWLGGQHGEEIEDEVCGEEDGEEDQAQERSEEEVVSSLLNDVRLRTMSKTASNGPAASQRSITQ